MANKVSWSLMVSHGVSWLRIYPQIIKSHTHVIPHRLMYCMLMMIATLLVWVLKRCFHFSLIIRRRNWHLLNESGWFQMSNIPGIGFQDHVEKGSLVQKFMSRVKSTRKLFSSRQTCPTYKYLLSHSFSDLLRVLDSRHTLTSSSEHRSNKQQQHFDFLFILSIGSRSKHLGGCEAWKRLCRPHALSTYVEGPSSSPHQ